MRVLIEDSDRVLLARRSDVSKYAPNRWELPGGKVDTGELLWVGRKGKRGRN